MKQTVVFKKRRWYGGKLREPGAVVSMEYKHARAFIRVKAAVLATDQTKKKKAAPPKVEKQTVEPVAEIKTELQEEAVVDPEPEQALEEEEPEPEEVEELVPPVLEDLSYRELQELCKQRDLPASGMKSELIYRLKEGE